MNFDHVLMTSSLLNNATLPTLFVDDRNRRKGRNKIGNKLNMKMKILQSFLLVVIF